MKTKVLTRMKPKVASLGFTKEELDGVAATIAGNLQDDATEEQMDVEIDKALPFLRVSQSMATRVINAEKEKLPKAPAGASDPKPKGANPDESHDDEPAWFKTYREEQDKRLNELMTARVTEQRKLAFEAKIKDLLPKQKEAMMEDFNRLSFKDDADFNAYLEKKSEVVAAINQELANEGLAKMSRPIKGGTALSEEDEFAKTMKEINTEKTE